MTRDAETQSVDGCQVAEAVLSEHASSSFFNDIYDSFQVFTVFVGSFF